MHAIFASLLKLALQEAWRRPGLDAFGGLQRNYPPYGCPRNHSQALSATSPVDEPLAVMLISLMVAAR